MSSLYLSQHEMAAIKAIDTREVERRVDQALDEGRPTALYSLHLSNAGAHIATHLHRYEQDPRPNDPRRGAERGSPAATLCTRLVR